MSAIVPSGRPIVALANRLPVAPSDEGKWRPATGEIVTALRPVMELHDGAWVGWDGGHGGVPQRVPGLDIDLLPLSLSHAQLAGFYYGFANRSVWPLFHDLVQQPTYDRGWWRAYVDVNHMFAETAAKVDFGDRTPLLWVHDYHLMLLPKLLRETMPGAPVAFFLHIPFPAAELFARLSWREQVLDGLLGADVVSFHTEGYRRNFVAAVERLHPLDVATEGNDIHIAGRRIRTAVHPISIDAKSFAELATSDETERELALLREQMEGRRVLLGVDRLDYTKRIHERLRAVELLLERREDLRTTLAFVQIAVPSREEVQEYRDLRDDVEREVGRINGRFTEPGHPVPVYYLHREMPPPALAAYYRLADVGLVTPLKDGMNLIAKEFVVCQHAAGGTGALVLSEFTGAHLELRETIACNPFDIEGLSHRFEQTLGMHVDERRRRLTTMATTVHRNDVFAWVRSELDEVERVAAAT